LLLKAKIPIAIESHCLIRFIEGRKNIENRIKKLAILFCLFVKINEPKPIKIILEFRSKKAL
jgi:hypothetical protein